MNLQKKFLQFDHEDQKLLQDLQQVFTEHADEIVDAFYNHLLMFEETRDLLSREDVGKRLKGLQKEYLISLTSGHYDEAYVESRKQIGKTHNRIKLLPKYYLGMYSFYLGLLLPLVMKKYAHDPVKLSKSIMALIKITNLDSQIAMQTYIDSYHDKLSFANKELERLNWELEKKVDQRTQQLKTFELKFRETERLALIGTLASEIAHEVGTPLNIITGRVELLMQKAKTNEKMQKDLESITQQIERITRIIRDLLDMSRPKQPTFAPMNLLELLEGTLEFMRIHLEKASIDATLSPDEESVWILGDRDQLQQVFLNIIMNALQAMNQSGKISVGTQKSKHETNSFIVVTIEDTGAGIPAENLQRIFDPFFSTKERGTGLGLPIADDIIKKHGGRISVRSEVGKGSTFEVWLPELKS